MGLTKSQAEALEILNSGQNVFLTGEAGTGKSFVIREFMKNSDKNILLCASTGIAAIQIGGETLHRVFKIPVRPLSCGEKGYPTDVVKNTDILIIDEISMVRFDVFSFISQTLIKLKKKIQLIVVGDFFQLPPVITDKDRAALHSLWDDKLLFGFNTGFAFESNDWNLWNFKTIWLTEIMRQDDEIYAGLLNQIRIGNHSAIKHFNAYCWNDPSDKGIYVCGLNRTADSINSTKMEELTTESKKYIAEINGKFKERPVPEELELKVGAKVMSLINYGDGAIKVRNGSIGIVESLNKDSVDVRFDELGGKVVNFAPYMWENYEYVVQAESNGKKKVTTKKIGDYRQIPLKIAYAITIHKSQGQTFDEINLDPFSFTHGQLYVALSRGRRLKGLHLTKMIRDEWLILDPSVKKFYELALMKDENDLSF